MSFIVVVKQIIITTMEFPTEATPLSCTARDTQDAMQFINNIGVAYLDAGEIIIAKAFFIQALRLKAKLSMNDLSVMDNGNVIDKTIRDSPQDVPILRSTATSKHQSSEPTCIATQIDVAAMATRILTMAVKRHVFGGSSAQTTTTGHQYFFSLSQHPCFQQHAIAVPMRQSLSIRCNPLVATANVIFNLALVHHTLALMDARSHDQMMIKAQLLYEEALSLLNVVHCQKHARRGHFDLLRLSLYNNLGHVAFQFGRYESCAIFMQLLHKVVMEAPNTGHRSFLLNSMLLVAPTLAAAA